MTKTSFRQTQAFGDSEHFHYVCLLPCDLVPSTSSIMDVWWQSAHFGISFEWMNISKGMSLIIENLFPNPCKFLKVWAQFNGPAATRIYVQYNRWSRVLDYCFIFLIILSPLFLFLGLGHRQVGNVFMNCSISLLLLLRLYRQSALGGDISHIFANGLIVAHRKNAAMCKQQTYT